MRVARSALRFPPSARLFSTAGPIIGVDLGTTNSCVAVLEGQTPRVIENSEGQRTTPSCVAFTDKGVLIGTPARRQAVQNSENTFYATKRLIGRKFKDPAVQKDLATSHYKIVAHKSGDAWVEAKGQQYSPSQIGSFVLTKMKETAEAALNTTVRDAVITVPAYFNESQRQATKDAGKIAGLNVHRIINEPTAAALAYGLNKQDGKTIVVYDLGGGTFDVSVLQIERGVFEVKATNGDTMLGGEDFDTLLQNHFVTKFKEQHGIDLSNDRLATHRLREAAEHAKIDLSSSTKTDIDVPYIATGPNGPVHFQYSITRQQHDELVNHLLQRSIAPCDKALKDAGVTKKDIGEVILVGGMTRMPAVQKLVSQLFERPPNKSVNPDEVVASGAAIQGGVLKGDVKDILLIDVTPLSIGFENPDGTFSAVVPRNSPLPVKKSKTISTHHDLQTSMYIHVYQGEREFAADNKYLGLLTLTGIPPSKAGVPKIEIGFNIEAGGVINVSARDKGLNKVVHVTLQPDGGLTEADVERMVKDAEKFAAADAARKQRVGLMGQARFLLQTAQEALDNNKEQLPAEMVERVTTAIDELQEEIRHDEGEVDPMNKKMETVRQASYALGEYIYKNAKGSADEEKKD